MLGKTIDNLLRTNIELWHHAIKIKVDGKPLRTMPTRDRVKTFYTIRKLNTSRSKCRWEIDRAVGMGTNENKINYSGG